MGDMSPIPPLSQLLDDCITVEHPARVKSALCVLAGSELDKLSEIPVNAGARPPATPAIVVVMESRAFEGDDEHGLSQSVREYPPRR